MPDDEMHDEYGPADERLLLAAELLSAIGLNPARVRAYEDDITIKIKLSPRDSMRLRRILDTWSQGSDVRWVEDAIPHSKYL